MRIAFVTAMDIEYRHLVAMLGGDTGHHGNHDVVVCQSGIGKVNAALTVQQLIATHHPDAVVSTGLAGGLAAQLKPGDMVVASATAYHDVWCGMGNVWGQVQGLPARFEGDSRLLDMCRRVESATHVVEGLIVTGDQFIQDPAAREAILQKQPDALACDMESAAIAQTCHLLKTPFLSMRLISDTPGTDGHQVQWETFLSNMSEQSFTWIKAFLEK